MGREVWKPGGRAIFEAVLVLFCFFLKWDHRNRVAAGGPCEVRKGSDAGRNGPQLRTAVTMMEGWERHSRRVWSHGDTPLTVGGGKMRCACKERGDTARKGWIHLFPPAL